MSSAAPLRERAQLRDCRRLVVKIGSALLAAPQTPIYIRVAAEIAGLTATGKQVVLVSSGAIALGLGVMGWQRRPTSLASLQAAAAAGQPELMRRWGNALKKHGVSTAQVLVTHADLADRSRFLNARRAISELLSHGVLPVINENDSVATDEIRVGDNDQLSAHVASLIDADLLVILTSVDGIYTGNPEHDPKARRLSQVDHPESVADVAGEAGSSGLGVGGMRTKVEAARAAVSRAIPVVIAGGVRRHVLRDILAGDDVGSLFVPTGNVTDRKHWIAYTLKARGILRVDRGAAQAVLHAGKSLLPSGMTAVEGEFERGAMVEIWDPDGLVARGLAAYTSDEMRRLQGHSSHDIAEILGYIDVPEVVHRDDLVVVRAL